MVSVRRGRGPGETSRWHCVCDTACVRLLQYGVQRAVLRGILRLHALTAHI